VFTVEKLRRIEKRIKSVGKRGANHPNLKVAHLSTKDLKLLIIEDK
jgi:hypothetical protein